MKKIISVIIVAVLALTLVTACSSGGKSKLKDGTYTAVISEERTAADERGWQYKLTIQVVDGAATVQDFDSYNLEDGRRKSEDADYAELMKKDSPTDPTIFFAEYIKNWDAAKGVAKDITTVAGATNTGDILKELTIAVVAAAEKGETTEVVVE